MRKGSAMVFEVENFRDTPKKLRKRINMKKIIEKEYDIP